MRSFVPLLLAAALVGGTSACGDLSQEDLLFRAAVPSKKDVEVRPAGVESEADDASDSTATQALEVECEDTDLRCKSIQIAKGLNGITFALLDLVDFVVAQPPSKRSPGRRVWGPYFDAAKGTTARFEMFRLEDGVSYAFCLHAAAGFVGELKAKDVSCETDVDDESGMTLVLSGTFSPGDLEGARARTGAGSMTLETARLPDLAEAGRQMVIDFNNADNRTDIDITVVGQRVPGSVQEREPVIYGYTREADGSGTFDFDLLFNFVKDTVRPEDLVIKAKWNADQAGRADASITGGDIQGDGLSVSQCWDADGADVFRETRVPPDQVQTVGDADQCVLPDSLL